MIDYLTRKYTAMKTNISTWYNSIWSSKERVIPQPIVKPSISKEHTIDTVANTWKEVATNLNTLVDNTELGKANTKVAELREEITRLQALNRELSTKPSAKAENAAELSKAKTTILEYRNANKKLNKDIYTLHEQLKQIEEIADKKLRVLLDERVEADERWRNAKGNVTRKYLAIEEKDVDLADKDAAIEKLREENAELKAVNSELSKIPSGPLAQPLPISQPTEAYQRIEEQLNKVKTELENKDRELETSNKAVKELEKQMRSKQASSEAELVTQIKERDRAIAQLNNVKTELENKDKAIAAVTNNVEVQQNTVKDLRDTIEEKDATIEEIKHKITLANNTIGSLNKEKENLQAQMQVENKQINPLAIRVKELEQLVENSKKDLETSKQECNAEHRKVMSLNENLYKLNPKIQTLEGDLTKATFTEEMKVDKSTRLQAQISDLKMQLENKDRSIDELEYLLDTERQQESIAYAQQGNQLATKIEEIQINKAFIAENYEAVKQMYKATAQYRECINEIGVLKEKIFLMETQALDHEIGYKLSKKQEELRLQKMCESYVTEYTNELRTIETKLQSAIDNTENCYRQVNTNVQQFNEAQAELDKQIKTTTELLSTSTKPLSPLERIQMDPLPKRDLAETKKAMLALINAKRSSIPESSPKSKDSITSSPPITNKVNHKQPIK